MSKHGKGGGKTHPILQRLAAAQPRPQVDVRQSLLDSMADGSEFSSIVSIVPPADLNLVDELKRGLREIAALRDRPCLLYVGNVANGTADAAVIGKDDLPFAEMIRSVPEAARKVDVFLATNGGSAPQVARFVNALRARFDEVDFLIPSFCMSAGTLFALSGDRIWMTPDACLGPIDPQVPTQGGRFVPAQALLLLVDKLQADGQDAIKKGQPVPWTAVRIIDGIDKKDLGDAMTASQYAETMAVQFLVNYKFRHWHERRSSKQAVSPEYRVRRATEIAKAFASHERWKNHGHALSRDVLWEQVKLEIEHPDAGLERAIRRTWALCYWLFDKTTMQKMIVSADYGYLTWKPVDEGQKK